MIRAGLILRPMALHCPDCGLPIPTAEVAPSAGLAVCRLCDRTYTLAACQEALPIEERVDLPLGAPPKGVTLAEGMDGFRLTLSTRSPMALFLVPFTLFWAGGSLGGLYGTQIAKGEFNLMMSLFGIPFLIGSVFLIGFTAMTVAGRQVIELKGGRLHVHAGAFGLRWGRSVDWRDVGRCASMRGPRGVGADTDPCTRSRSRCAVTSLSRSVPESIPSACAGRPGSWPPASGSGAEFPVALGPWSWAICVHAGPEAAP